MQELISVIVSVYNVEKYLPRCLKSISSQTYRNLDIILVDDGSTDSSGILCDDFAANDPRARVFHQDNQGLWGARNKGLKEARGEYLVFPDGDDSFHEDYVRLLYQAINFEGIQYPVAICGYQRTANNLEEEHLETLPEIEIWNQKLVMKELFENPFNRIGVILGANWNKMYRRSILPFPFQRNFLRCQDLDSNLRIYVKVSHVALININLYNWISRPGSLTNSHDDLIIRSESRARLFYDNYQELLKDEKKEYGHYYLVALYTRLLMWKNLIAGSPSQRDSSSKIKEYGIKTLPAFIKCPSTPFLHKLRLLIPLFCPFTTRILKMGYKRCACIYQRIRQRYQ